MLFIFSSQSNSLHFSREQTFTDLDQVSTQFQDYSVVSVSIRSKKIILGAHTCCVFKLQNNEYLAFELCSNSSYQVIHYKYFSDLVKEFGNLEKAEKDIDFELEKFISNTKRYKEEKKSYYILLNNCNNFSDYLYLRAIDP